jgi:DNA topoisomerase-1
VDVDAEGKPVKPIDTGISCEKCGSPMIVRKSFRGPFLGCSAYPKCRSTKTLTPELKEKFKIEAGPATGKKKAADIDAPPEITCPECGGPMKLKPGRWGKFFFGCAKFPKCRGTQKASPEIVEQLTSAVAQA